MGNKSRYLEPLVEAVLGVAHARGPVVDLFAGTGVVSRALATHRTVISADIQAYSSTLTSALCAPRIYSGQELSDIVRAAQGWLSESGNGEEALIAYEDRVSSSANRDPLRFALMVEDGSLTSDYANDNELAATKRLAAESLRARGARLSAHYGGVYFSYRQALEIDALLAAIGHSARKPAEATLLAAVLGVTSDSVSTVGNHFAQPVRLRDRSGAPKISAIAQSLKSRSRSVFDGFSRWVRRYGALAPAPNACHVQTGDFRRVLRDLPRDVAAVYADPPYTRDHYSRFYHVLETIALGDDPGVSTAPGSNRPSRGLYREDRHQSPFSIRSLAMGAFSGLLASVGDRGIPLVLSYSPQGTGTAARPETRMLTIEELVKMAEQHYANVEVRTISSSSHSQFNLTALSGRPAEHAEVLIVARP